MPSKRRPAKLLLLLAGVLGALAGVTAASGGREGGSVVAHYTIRSLGLSIGTVNSTIAGSAADNDFHADTEVDVGVAFLSFSLKSSETTSIRGGRVLRYHKIVDTGGHRREITGERTGSALSLVVSDRGKTERRVFPLTSFAGTSMDYPEMTLIPGEVRQMRIVDLENAEVVNREYRQVSETQQEVAGRMVRVVIADLADKNSECRRWTAVVNGLPIVLRQEGKEKTGRFSAKYLVRQTKVQIED